jgi:hypothetical protein
MQCSKRTPYSITSSARASSDGGTSVVFAIPPVRFFSGRAGAMKSCSPLSDDQRK